VIVALGVDPMGKKHLLGLREGASENAVVVSALLEDLVARGLSPRQRRLFVIDGAKALRAAIERVFGGRVPVQRCRNHKLRNVRDHLPPHLQAQVTSAMRAAFRLEPQEGIAKLKRKPPGWSVNTRMRRAACVKAWRSYSPSTGSGSRPRCAARWVAPTSSKIPISPRAARPIG
jgi:transposase-like protein